MDMIVVSTKDISRERGHIQPQRDGCRSEVGALGERDLVNMVRWNNGTPQGARGGSPNFFGG